MGAAASDPKTGLIKAVQTCRRQVAGLEDDATWRAFLAKHAGGQTSTRAMTVPQLGKVLDGLRSAGAAPAPGRATPAPAGGGGRGTTQDGVIKDLWRQLHQAGGIDDPSDRALARWAKRFTKVDAIAFAKPRQKQTLIEALKGWLARLPADPVVPIRLAARGEDGATDPVRFCAGLWEGLIAAGAFTHGIHADPATWLRQQGFGVAAWQFLTTEQAFDAAGRLAGWLRRVVDKGGGDGH